MFFDPDADVDWDKKARNKRDEIESMEILLYEMEVTKVDDYSDEDRESVEAQIAQKVTDYNTLCQNLPEDHEWYQAP
jgi:hypothetical protein